MLSGGNRRGVQATLVICSSCAKRCEPESAGSASRLLGEMQVKFPPPITAILSTDRQITLLFAHFCLKTLMSYSGPSFSVGDKYPQPQWLPEAADGTKPCMYCLFSCTYLPVIKFTASLWHTPMAGVTAPVLWGRDEVDPGQCGRAQ